MLNKTRWSWQGFRAAFVGELAIRLESLIVVASVVLAFLFDLTRGERALVIALPFLLLAVELLNTAIEAVVDLASPDQHPLAKLAKDCGSAAVFVMVLAIGSVWAVILFG